MEQYSWTKWHVFNKMQSTSIIICWKTYIYICTKWEIVHLVLNIIFVLSSSSSSYPINANNNSRLYIVCAPISFVRFPQYHKKYTQHTHTHVFMMLFTFGFEWGQSKNILCIYIHACLAVKQPIVDDDKLCGIQCIFLILVDVRLQ